MSCVHTTMKRLPNVASLKPAANPILNPVGISKKLGDNGWDAAKIPQRLQPRCSA